MKMSEDITEFAAAFAKAQGMIENAKRDRENTFFKNKFADLASIREAIREPMAANDLSMLQFPRTRDNGVEIETMLLHKSGQYMSETTFWPASKVDVHGLASALTYGRRQSAMAILGVAPDDDDDGNAAVEKPSVVRNGEPIAVPGKPLVSNGDPKLAAAEAVAKEGSNALRDYWTSLSAEDRKLFPSHVLKSLKATAASADSAKGA
jgi:hypothetical protein